MKYLFFMICMTPGFLLAVDAIDVPIAINELKEWDKRYKESTYMFYEGKKYLRKDLHFIQVEMIDEYAYGNLIFYVVKELTYIC